MAIIASVRYCVTAEGDLVQSADLTDDGNLISAVDAPLIAEEANPGGSLLDGGTDSVVCFRLAQAPTGEFDELAERGALCINTANGNVYINVGTVDTNDWVVIGIQA